MFRLEFRSSKASLTEISSSSTTQVGSFCFSKFEICLHNLTLVRSAYSVYSIRISKREREMDGTGIRGELIAFKGFRDTLSSMQKASKWIGIL